MKLADRSVLVSIIIPAFNEECVIQQTLCSILSIAHDSFDLEVIVVDNDSDDATYAIADKYASSVYRFTGGPVGAVRNFGVSKSKGDILIFLDADVEVTDAWHENIESTVLAIVDDNKIVTGSHCSTPTSSSGLLAKYWFAAIENASSSHLGTGHLIVSKALFEDVGGFDKALETGEDYDFCQKAMKSGGRLFEDQRLKVIHNGYPNNLGSFFSREAWHGIGDVTSLRNAVQSKVFLSSTLYVFLLICFCSSLIVGSFSFGLTTFLAILIFLVALSSFKFSKRGWGTVIVNALVFNVYLLARFSSVFILIFRRSR